MQNEPEGIKQLRVDAWVKFSVEKIFDFLWIRPDGSQEGTETGRVLRRQPDRSIQASFQVKRPKERKRRAKKQQ